MSNIYSKINTTMKEIKNRLSHDLTHFIYDSENQDERLVNYISSLICAKDLNTDYTEKDELDLIQFRAVYKFNDLAVKYQDEIGLQRGFKIFL